MSVKKIVFFLPLAKESVDTEFFQSYVTAKTYLNVKAGDLPFEFVTVDYYCHTFPIDANRNECAEKLLEGLVLDNKTIFKPDISIWVDTDHKIPPDAFFKLLEHNLPIILGVYYIKVKGRHAPFYPVLFKEREDDEGLYKAVMEFPDKELFEVDFAGMGCACIHREVFEKLERPYFKYMLHPAGSANAESFWKNTHDINDVSEDRWFWDQVKAKTNYPILVDPQVQLGHIGKMVFDKEMYFAWRDTYKRSMIEKEGSKFIDNWKKMAIAKPYKPKVKKWTQPIAVKK